MVCLIRCMILKAFGHGPTLKSRATMHFFYLIAENASLLREPFRAEKIGALWVFFSSKHYDWLPNQGLWGRNTISKFYFSIITFTFVLKEKLRKFILTIIFSIQWFDLIFLDLTLSHYLLLDDILMIID